MQSDLSLATPIPSENSRETERAVRDGFFRFLRRIWAFVTRPARIRRSRTVGYLCVGSWGWGLVYRLDRLAILFQGPISQLDPSFFTDVGICGTGGIPDRHGENRISLCDYLQRTALRCVWLALLSDGSMFAKDFANQTSRNFVLRVWHGGCEL